MRPAAYPRDFEAFRAAAIAAEVAGRTVRAYTRAAASVSSTAERMQRVVDSVAGNDEQPAPSPFEAYRSRATTRPTVRVPFSSLDRGDGQPQHLSVFSDLNSAVPVPVAKTSTIVTRNQLAQMLNISPRWAAELGRIGVFPRIEKNQYDATDLLSRWIAYKFSGA